ncbi:MAG: class I SAM-dependent methyltransferase [Edaphobacter sp.]
MKTEPDFNRIARPYRWLEYVTLGTALESCRTHYLPQLLNRRHALVLGDGDGRFLADLMAANPQLQAEAVDSSATMLRLLRQRCEATSCNAAARLQIHHTPALSFAPAGPYDLVVTHFFLDCLTQPEIKTLIDRVAPALAPDALWLISDFRIPPGAMRLPARIVVRTLYLAFRLLTGLRTNHLPDYRTPLTQAGLSRVAHHQSLAGLLSTELWQI